MIAHTLLIPALLVIRMWVIAPASWFIPSFRRIVERRLSSLVINPLYVREMDADERRALLGWEILSVACWVAAAFLLGPAGVLRLLGVYCMIFGGVAVINAFRTLGSHHYEGDGQPMDRNSQVIDSVDTPDAWWAALWFPVGLRFHALHHFLPTMPYHNLGVAHRRLVAALSADAGYHLAVSPRLSHTLATLWSDGGPVASGRHVRAGREHTGGKSAEAMPVLAPEPLHTSPATNP